MARIGVIGGGAWGTALAVAAGRAGAGVSLWCLEPEVAASINAEGVNRMFLDGVKLDPRPEATTDLSYLAGADALLMVTPAQFLRKSLSDLRPHLGAATPILICSKGIELATGKLLTEIVDEELGDHPVGILTGPTFAKEVAEGLPAALTLAYGDAESGRRLMELLGSRSFRPYLSDDLVGAQIGGAVKNVMAIACGITLGRKLGENSRAALITRGLAEMTRFALALGGKRETLMGLSGLGDLTLTCNSLQSRNMSFGHALGEGRSIQEILGGRKSVTEGFYTAAAVVRRAGEAGVDMPICEAMDRILNHGDTIEAALYGLLDRPFRDEAV
jgi:glycerol-3-phosphate dehydrogenase (NAD(P)+)